MADNLKKIGAKITLDGEKEYKQALKNITSEQKVLRSEMKLAQAQFTATGGSIESMQQKSKVLNDQIAAQTNKIDVLKEALEKAKEQYGENSSQANSWQTQLNYAETDLVNLNSALADNEAALKGAQEGASDAGDAVGDLDKELADTENTSKGWGARLLENLSFTDIINLGKTAFGVISNAAQAVYQTVQESAAYADDVLTQAAQNGIDTADVQTLNYMSELIDTPTEAITGAMTKITKAMDRARDGSTKYKDEFAKIGVQYTNDDGTLRNTNDVFWDTVDALSKMEPGAERNAIAMDLFGKSAKELTGVINTGSRGFKNYSKEAKAMGVVLSETQLGVLGDTNDAFYKLDQSMQGLKLATATAFAPAIRDATEVITSMIMGVTNLIGGLSDDYLLEIDEIDRENKELKNKISSNKDEFTQEQSVISGSVIMAGALADRIYDLAGKSDRTATEENELAAALLKINQIIPGLNLQFDKQTGTLSKTREEVDKLTTSYKNQALEQAFAKRRAELLEDYATATLNRIRAEQKMLGEAGEHLDWYTKLQDTYNALDPGKFVDSSQRLGTAISEIRDDLGEMADVGENADMLLWMERLGQGIVEITDAEDNVKAAEQAMEDYNEQCRLASDQMGITTETIDDLSEAAGDASESTDELGGSISDLGADEAAEDLTELQRQLKAYADSAGVSLESVETHFTELADAYAEAYKSAESSITGQTGLFNTLSTESEMTADQMLNNLLGQNDVLAQWTADIEKLRESKLADGLIQQLVDAGPSAAKAVHDLAGKVTDENNTFIEQLNAAYKDQLDIKSGFAEAMAEAETGFNQYAADLGLSSEVVEEELANRGVTAGAAFGNNLIDGLSQSAALDDSSEEILAKAEENAEAYKQSGESAATNYAEGIQTALATSKEQLSTDLSGIEELFETSKDTVGEYGSDAIIDFLTGMSTELTNTDNIEPVQAGIEAIETLFANSVPVIDMSGVDAGTGYLDEAIKALGNDDKLHGATNSIESRLADIVSIADSKVTPMSGSGKNMGNALIDGFIASVSARLGEVAAAAGSIEGSVNAAMEIRSPSRVMSRSGGYIGEGLIEGTVSALHDGLPEITEEMARMTDQLSGYSIGALSMAPPAQSTPAPVTYTAELAALRSDIATLAQAVLERPIMLDSGELVGGISGKLDMTFAQSQVYHQRRN